MGSESIAHEVELAVDLEAMRARGIAIVLVQSKKISRQNITNMAGTFHY